MCSACDCGVHPDTVGLRTAEARIRELEQRWNDSAAYRESNAAKTARILQLEAALTFIRDGSIPQGMPPSMFADRVLAGSALETACVEDNPCQCRPEGYCNKNALRSNEHCRKDRAAFEAKTAVCQPGQINPEPQDYKVQCLCGWMGMVSTLKSLPEFKMGCPVCSTEFVPFDKIAWPVSQANRKVAK